MDQIHAHGPAIQDIPTSFQAAGPALQMFGVRTTLPIHVQQILAIPKAL
jgi:hypothetical protein